MPHVSQPSFQVTQSRGTCEGMGLLVVLRLSRKSGSLLQYALPLWTPMFAQVGLSQGYIASMPPSETALRGSGTSVAFQP